MEHGGHLCHSDNVLQDKDNVDATEAAHNRRHPVPKVGPPPPLRPVFAISNPEMKEEDDLDRSSSETFDSH